MAGIQIFNPTAPDFGDANTLLMSGLKGLSSSFEPFAEQINKNQTTADTNLLGLLQQAATQYGVGTPEFMAAEENLRGLNPNANVDEFKYAGVLDTARLNAQNSTQADLLADKTRADINSVQYNDQNVIAETAGRKLLNVGQETKNVQEQGQLAEQSLFNQLAAELNNPNLTPEEKQTKAATMAKQFQFSDISKLITENRTQTHTEDNASNDSILRSLALGVNASQAANQGADRQYGNAPAFSGATGGGANNSVVKSSPTQTTSTTGSGSNYNVVGKIDYNGKPIQANANRDKYMNSIVNAARYHGVDPAFALAKFHTESDFNPTARSGKGATGIAQLMGPTAKEMGVQDINDPEQNIVGGIKYIASLMKKYNGDMRAVSMAYNMGPNAYDTKPPGQETRNHAERVLNRYNSYQSSGGSGAQNLQSAASGKAQTAGNDKHIKYVNSKATRNQKLDSGLSNSLSFMGSMGVTMEVNSGGQAAKGSGGKRVGSTAHDHGHAADGVLKYQGRTLDWNKKEDKAILSKVVEEAAANGINGFGAGYMGKGRFHFGKQKNAASWGGGGTEKSKGYSWVNEAIKKGTARYQANGGAAGQAPSSSGAAFSQGLSNTPDMLAAADERINTRNNLLSEQGDMGNQFLKLLAPNGELDTPQTNSIYDAYNSAIGMVSSANESKVRESAIKDQEAINAQSSLQAQAAQENSIDLGQLIGPDDKQHFYAFLESKGLDPEKLQRMGPNDMDILVDNWFSYIQPIKKAEYAALDKSATYLSNDELSKNFKGMKSELNKSYQTALSELTKDSWGINVNRKGDTHTNLLTSAIGLTETNQDKAAAPYVVPMKIISNMERELANNREMYGATFSASTGAKISDAVKSEMDTWILGTARGGEAFRDYQKSGKLPTKDYRNKAQIESDFKKYGTRDFAKIVTDKLNNLTVQIMRNTSKRSVIETREALEKLQQQRVGINYYKTAKDTRKALTLDDKDSKRKTK